MKKSLLISLPVLLLSTASCVDSLTDYNVDPKSATKVPGVTLVSTAERALGREVTSSSVNENPFRLYVQYWGQTTYFDESIYDIKTRQIDRNFWNQLYRGGGSADPTLDQTGVLRNLSEAQSLISSDAILNAKVKANQLACIEVLAVYTWATLVNTYGNVPYSEALNGTKSQPKYDDAKTIYTDLFRRLDAAILALDDSAEGLGGADIVYQDDVAGWKKFANSLKLRMALTIADDDAVKAKALAEQAAPNVFSDNSENATVDFIASTPNTHPVWEDLIQSGRHDFVGTDFFVNNLKAVNDPRLPVYFKPVANTTTFTGGIYGQGNVAASFSNPGSAIEDPEQPGVLESYSEVEFLLAEAVERGFNVGGTAASHYAAAVTASIEEWGGSAADAATYLAQPTVAYATAPGTYKQKIGTQKWIALYNQPVQAWTEWRRLDYPHLTKPAGAKTDIPLRFTYPTPESNVNGANYSAASAAMGGDVVTSKIFWDKF
jgi:hypothetical protein